MHGKLYLCSAVTHLISKEQVTNGLVFWILHYCPNDLQHGSDTCRDTSTNLKQLQNAFP